MAYVFPWQPQRMEESTNNFAFGWPQQGNQGAGNGFSFQWPQQTPSNGQFQWPRQVVPPPNDLFTDGIEALGGASFETGINFSQQGSKKAPYVMVSRDQIDYECITYMDQYQDTFPTELRARDYAMNQNQRPISKV